MTVTHKGDPSRMAVPMRRTRGSVRGESAWAVRGSPQNDMKKTALAKSKEEHSIYILVTYNCSYIQGM